VGSPRAARRKNDAFHRNLRYLSLPPTPDSFHWLIVKTQTQGPIRSLGNLEMRFFPTENAILPGGQSAARKRANRLLRISELQVPDTFRTECDIRYLPVFASLYLLESHHHTLPEARRGRRRLSQIYIELRAIRGGAIESAPDPPPGVPSGGNDASSRQGECTAGGGLRCT
jgi:hypothetical protein